MWWYTFTVKVNIIFIAIIEVFNFKVHVYCLLACASYRKSGIFIFVILFWNLNCLISTNSINLFSARGLTLCTALSECPSARQHFLCHGSCKVGTAAGRKWTWKNGGGRHRYKRIRRIHEGKYVKIFQKYISNQLLFQVLSLSFLATVF